MVQVRKNRLPSARHGAPPYGPYSAAARVKDYRSASVISALCMQDYFGQESPNWMGAGAKALRLYRLRSWSRQRCGRAGQRAACPSAARFIYLPPVVSATHPGADTWPHPLTRRENRHAARGSIDMVRVRPPREFFAALCDGLTATGGTSRACFAHFVHSDIIAENGDSVEQHSA